MTKPYKTFYDKEVDTTLNLSEIIEDISLTININASEINLNGITIDFGEDRDFIIIQYTHPV